MTWIKNLKHLDKLGLKMDNLDVKIFQLRAEMLKNFDQVKSQLVDITQAVQTVNDAIHALPDIVRDIVQQELRQAELARISATLQFLTLRLETILKSLDQPLLRQLLIREVTEPCLQLEQDRYWMSDQTRNAIRGPAVNDVHYDALMSYHFVTAQSTYLLYSMCAGILYANQPELMQTRLAESNIMQEQFIENFDKKYGTVLWGVTIQYNDTWRSIKLGDLEFEPTADSDVWRRDNVPSRMINVVVDGGGSKFQMELERCDGKRQKWTDRTNVLTIYYHCAHGTENLKA